MFLVAAFVETRWWTNDAVDVLQYGSPCKDKILFLGFSFFFPLYIGTKTPYGSGKPDRLGRVCAEWCGSPAGGTAARGPARAQQLLVCCSGCDPNSKELKNLVQNCKSLS